jgi:hypothetical protein
MQQYRTKEILTLHPPSDYTILLWFALRFYHDVSICTILRTRLIGLMCDKSEEIRDLTEALPRCLFGETEESY